MIYPEGISDYFCSQMRYFADHQLIERIGFGFDLRLNVAVGNGDLRYHSNGHFWQWGKFSLTIADWLLLGTATISEHAILFHNFIVLIKAQKRM